MRLAVRKMFVGLVVGMSGVWMIAGSANGSLHYNEALSVRCVAVAKRQDPQLTALRLFFKGRHVDQLVSGNKIKKYSMELTGSGLVPGSNVVVNSLRAYGFDGSQPELPVTTTFEDVMNLRATFLAPAKLRPGLLFIKVVTPEGVESNLLTAEVISDPTELSITAINPMSGPIGTRVRVDGVGFRADSKDGITAIRFQPVGPDDRAVFAAYLVEGFYIDSPSNGQTLDFIVPGREILPICPGGAIGCDPLSTPQITAGQYRVSLINRAGMSNGVLFEVAASQ